MTTRNYGKRWLSAALAGLALIGSSATTQLLAQNTTAAPAAAPAAAAPAAPAAAPAPTLEQRVLDLENEVNNQLPGTETIPDPKDKTKTITVTWATNLAASGPGHNAWLLTSTAFVLMMTLPGLALFYGGMVRRKNVVSVLAQCFGITGMVTIVWWVCGYSLIFGASFTPDPTHPTMLGFFLGGTEFNFFKGVNSIPNTNYGNWVSQNVYACFQLMFAIITPALILGSIAERMKYSALMLFMTAWMFVVYFPQAHMLWGITGFMNGCWNAVAPIKAIDFAGGTVVHMSSGWSALTLCLILGPRLGFGKVPMPPHSIVNVLIGTGLLWVGWYGFNSGSAVAGDVIAANAFTTTTLATATGAMVWALVEWVVKGKPTCLGYCSGAIAGLVVITPAAGYVNPTGSMWIGLAAGTIPFFFVYKVKGWLGYDDALDTFGVHAIGGTTGAIMTGILADPGVNANLPNFLGTLITNHTLWIEQVKAVGITILLACCGTAIIAYILKFTIGIRPTPEQEEQGLDLTDHSEEGYILE